MKIDCSNGLSDCQKEIRYIDRSNLGRYGCHALPALEMNRNSVFDRSANGRAGGERIRDKG